MKPHCVPDAECIASGMKMQSCIHLVVPFDPNVHRYSIAYFLRAEDETMFMDGEEDPGVIPSEAFAFEEARSAEIRAILKAAQARAAAEKPLGSGDN